MNKYRTRAALLCTAIFGLSCMSSIALSDDDSPDVKHLRIENYTMPYIDVGKGEPVVFVHGAVSDLRTWSDFKEPISADHRFISYTRRWYGEQDWPTGDEAYSHDQHASDLAKLIEHVADGPVHLVTWSSGAISSTILAAERPELVKSIVHYEPVLDGVMNGVPGADELGSDWGALWGPVVDASKAGNSTIAVQKFIELVFELPEGGFDSIPEANKNIILANARTVPLLFFKNATKTDPDCGYLNDIDVPTKILLGGDTNKWWSLMSETISECMPNASLQKVAGVNHSGPIAAVDEISAIIENFVMIVR